MSLSGPLSIVRHRLFLPIAGALLSLAALWVFARPRPEVERARRHFLELQRQRGVVQQSQDARSELGRRTAQLREEATRSSDDQRAARNAEIAAEWTRQLWADRSAVRRAVLQSPLVTWPGVPAVRGTTSVYSARGSGCASCHVAVATQGYERYPEPFRTHVQLTSYVGADSPHPPSRMGCVVCHAGDDGAETFTQAGHSLRRQRSEQGAVPRVSTEETHATAAGAGPWSDPASPGAMLPVGRVAAGCARCHAGERFQPGADARNEALATLDRAGCYGCHVVPGLERAPRRGPALGRIAGKVTPQWTRQWLTAPETIKSNTWMPRFWPDSTTLSVSDRAEIEAVVAYLFASSEHYAPARATPPRGDVTRGQRLVALTGCLACHVVGPVARETTSLARTFGPPLQAIGSKATYAWLYDWVRDPSRFSPDTRMPRLRLSDAEAADVATYLASLTSDLPAIDAADSTEAQPFRDVIRRYAAMGASVTGNVDQLSLEAVKQAAGRAVIEARGCVNCHDIPGLGSARKAVPLAEPQGDSVHLHHSPSSGAPRELAGRGATVSGQIPQATRALPPAFALGPNEWDRVALGAAIAARTRPDDRSISVPWHVAKSNGRSVMQRHNCVGCHVVDGTGGEIVSTLASAGDGAPALDGVGARMTVGAVRDFLRQPGQGRGERALRMPTFALTGDDLDAIGSYLQAIAPSTAAPPGSASGRTQNSAPGLR